MKQIIPAILKAASLLLVIVVVISTGCQQQPDNSDSHNCILAYVLKLKRHMDIHML
jgi:hypothetical protein